MLGELGFVLFALLLILLNGFFVLAEFAILYDPSSHAADSHSLDT